MPSRARADLESDAMPPCAGWKHVPLAGDVVQLVEGLPHMHRLRRNEGGSEGLFPRNPINTQKNNRLRILRKQLYRFLDALGFTTKIKNNPPQKKGCV